MERKITITSKEFDKAVGDISHAIIQSGDYKTDKVIAAMLFSFAVFDQLYSDYSKKAADVPEKNVGEWTEKDIFYDTKNAIDAWQTCRCSMCGRYDTRPYLYYFYEPEYCSFCGASMKKGVENV